MLPTIDPLQKKRPIQTESERDGKKIPSKWTLKKAEVAILISDKIDFKTKTMKRDKERHYIIFEGIIHQEDIILITYMHPTLEHPNI